VESSACVLVLPSVFVSVSNPRSRSPKWKISGAGGTVWDQDYQYVWSSRGPLMDISPLSLSIDTGFDLQLLKVVLIHCGSLHTVWTCWGETVLVFGHFCCRVCNNIAFLNVTISFTLQELTRSWGWSFPMTYWVNEQIIPTHFLICIIGQEYYCLQQC